MTHSGPPDDAPDPWAAPPVNIHKDAAGTPPQPDAAPTSIWQTLDGSTPVRPAEPSRFTKPSTGPLEFPGLAPSRPSTGGGPAVTDDGRTVLTLAGWGSRLGAFLLDNLIAGFLVLLVSVPAAMAMGMSFDQALTFLSSAEIPSGVGSSDKFYALFVAQSLAQPTLLAIFLTRWNGQSPGKRALGLRVVRETGEPMTFAVAVRREVLAKTILIVLTFGLAFIPNYLWPLWDDQNRAGHDFLAKTRVVVDRT